MTQLHNITAAILETPIGPMIATEANQVVISLKFLTETVQDKAVVALISPGLTPVIELLAQELAAYFNGTLHAFTVPYLLRGTLFQRTVWQALTCIPYGQTLSYGVQACRVGKPRAWRAVAQANGANQLALIVPCHRIVQSDGKIGGYNGGVERKQWLLEHERMHACAP